MAQKSTSAAGQAATSPKVDALRRALAELRRAPMWEKASRAEVVATLSLELVADHEARIAALEHAAVQAGVQIAFGPPSPAAADAANSVPPVLRNGNGETS